MSTSRALFLRIASLLMDKVKRYGAARTILRISRRILLEIDQYIGFSRRLIILQANFNNRYAGEYKDKSWLDNEILVEKSQDQEFIQFVLTEKKKWSGDFRGWRTDEHANIDFPLLSPFSLRRWVLNNLDKKPDFMVPNERSKHNFLILYAFAYLITKEDAHIEEAQNALLDWRQCCPFGLGIPYYTTLNVAQRLINWSIYCAILKGKIEQRHSEHLRWLSVQADKDYRFLRKYNTGFYDLRNNFYICELVAQIIYLQTFLSTSSSRKKTLLEDELVEEVKQQITSDGFTAEGSVPYSRFVCELLALGYRMGITKLQSPMQKLFKSLLLLSSETGEIAAFGDVSCERAFQLYKDESILDAALFYNSIAVTVNEHPVKYKNTNGLILYQSIYSSQLRDAHKNIVYENKEVSRNGFVSYNRSWGKLVVDIDDIGLHGQGGHGHCDQGSFVLFNRKRSLVTDPGTLSYFSDSAIRDKYRSSVMHNVTSPDNHETCVLGPGPFQVRNSKAVRATMDAENSALDIFLPGFIVNGKHEPVHRKISVLDAGIIVSDEWDSLSGMRSRLHFSPGVSVVLESQAFAVITLFEEKWHFQTYTECEILVSAYICSPHYRIEKTAQRIEIKIPDNVKSIEYSLKRVTGK